MNVMAARRVEDAEMFRPHLVGDSHRAAPFAGYLDPHEQVFETCGWRFIGRVCRLQPLPCGCTAQDLKDGQACLDDYRDPVFRGALCNYLEFYCYRFTDRHGIARTPGHGRTRTSGEADDHEQRRDPPHRR